jgi:formylglycine-generating enzyme
LLFGANGIGRNMARQIFISYATPNLEAAKRVRSLLDNWGVASWFAKEDAIAGLPWPPQIDQALADCDLMILILTNAALNSDEVRSEISYYRVHKKRLIPLLFEQVPSTSLPVNLLTLQHIDFTLADLSSSINKLQQTLKDFGFQIDSGTPINGTTSHPGRATRIKRVWIVLCVVLLLPVLVVAIVLILLYLYPPEPYMGSNSQWHVRSREVDGIEQVYVPGACYEMGRTGDPRVLAHQVCVNAFWMDKTEVRQDDFQRLGGTQKNPPVFPGLQQPAHNVTWFEALSFCQIRGMRLVTEAEWEFAAKGRDGWEFPWGNDSNGANGLLTREAPTNVNRVATDTSWVGASDMGGNMNEWVSTAYGIWDPSVRQLTTLFSYPYQTNDNREDITDRYFARVIRGGSFLDTNARDLSTVERRYELPTTFQATTGFRCAVSNDNTP